MIDTIIIDMSPISRLLRRVAALVRVRGFDSDLDRQIEAHLALAEEDARAQGLSPEDARRQARLAFGPVDRAREEHREQRSLRWVERLAQDARYSAGRMLARPGFTSIAVLTLAIGIGANTLVVSVAKAVLFRSMEFDDPERLVWVRWANTLTGTTEDRLSWGDIDGIQASVPGIESLAAFVSRRATWEQHGRVEEFSGLGVTANLGADSHPIDEAISRDGHFLYVLARGAGRIDGMRIRADGSLVRVTTGRGFPRTAAGLAAH